MRIVKIEKEKNGSHRNQTGGVSRVPKGWAFVPDDFPLENFPFGEVVTAEMQGVETLVDWIPGEIPDEGNTEGE